MQAGQPLPVLIVGAGPTGLMAACELARRHIPFRIIDKNPSPVTTSNAIWIQPRTLELFDLFGIAETFVKKGQHCIALNLHARGVHTRVPLESRESLYPFFLMLPQCETEKLLIQYLEKMGSKVERAVTLVDVRQEQDSVWTTLQTADGKEEVVCTEWLLACDGANSQVRGKCGITFHGETLPSQFMVADARMDSFLSPDELHVFLGKETVCAVFPFRPGFYRVTANLHQSHPRKLFTQHEVRDIVHERTGGEFNVQEVGWVSPFWIHSRIVDAMQMGRVFFVGDAAHIHSPAGGQGMNAGIQDACNLAFKLALVIEKKAAPALLASYNAERYPVVKEIVNQTEQFTRALLARGAIVKKLREFVGADSSQALTAIGWRIAQMTIRYDASPVMHYSAVPAQASSHYPVPGMPAPDVRLADGSTVYRRLQSHLVLIFAGEGLPISAAAQALGNKIVQQFVGWVTVCQVSGVSAAATPEVIVDAEGILHRRYGVVSPTVCVVRPDGYLAYREETLESAPLEEFFWSYGD